MWQYNYMLCRRVIGDIYNTAGAQNVTQDIIGTVSRAC
jgi:hypothetical protein